MKYKKKLLIGFLLIVSLLMVSMSVFIAKFLLHGIKSSVEENALQISTAASMNLEMYFQNMDMVVKKISTCAELESAMEKIEDPQHVLEAKRKIDEIVVQGVSFVDMSEACIFLRDVNGNEQTSYANSKKEKGLLDQPEVRERLKPTEGIKRIIVSDNQNNKKYEGRDVLSIGRCIYNPVSEKVSGFVEVEISRFKVDELCNIGDLGSVFLLNRENEIVYPFDKVDQDTLRIVNNTESLKEAGLERYKILINHEIFDGQLKMVAIYNAKQIYKIFYDYEKYSYMLIFLITMIAFVLISIIIRSLMKPLEELRREIEKIADTGGKIHAGKSFCEDEFQMFSRTFNQMMEKLDAAKENEVLMRSQMERAKYDALQAQISPHFLQNILYTMNIVIQDGDKKSAVAMCRDLSRMMRYCVDISMPMVTLEDEINYVRSYLNLHAVIYEDDFTFTISQNADLKKWQIPKMSVQPFVENAFRHGFQQVRPPWKIELNCTEKGNTIEICIRDNGCGIEEEKINNIMERISGKKAQVLKQESSIGIVNTLCRLEYFFGDNFSFYIGQKQQGTEIILRFSSK